MDKYSLLQSEKMIQAMYQSETSIICYAHMQNPDTNELIYKTEIGLREVTNDYQRRMVKGKDRLEFGMDMYTLLYLK